MLTLNTKQKEFVDAAQKMYNKPTLNNQELLKVSKSLGMNFKPIPRFHEGFLCPDGRSAKTTLIGRMLPQPTVRTLDGKKKKLDDVIGYGFALLKIGDTNASDTKQLKRKIWTILDEKTNEKV